MLLGLAIWQNIYIFFFSSWLIGTLRQIPIRYTQCIGTSTVAPLATFFVEKETSIDYLHFDIFIFELNNVSLKLLAFTFGQFGPITLYVTKSFCHLFHLGPSVLEAEPKRDNLDVSKTRMLLIETLTSISARQTETHLSLITGAVDPSGSGCRSSTPPLFLRK